MKLHRLMGTALAVVLVAASAQAQYAYPPPNQPPPPPYGAPPEAPTLYAPPALDQMLAPIALYPDPLLTEVLAAATYPGEIDQAAQWRAAPQNAALAGPALAATVEGYDWDPSVKSLTPFPQILEMMDQHLDWTQALGNAFMAQQADVMDSIQRLRHAAYAAGTLVSSPYESVIVSGNYIEIQPGNPQTVYVPVYDPTRVYGAWAYPAYQPDYWGPPPGFAPRYAVGAIGFGLGIGVVDVLWHWGDWDWRHHDVRVDRDRFNRINEGHPPIGAATWHHDATRSAVRGGPGRAEPGRAQQANVPPQERRDLQLPEQQQRLQQANVPPRERRDLQRPEQQQRQQANVPPQERRDLERPEQQQRQQANVPPQERRDLQRPEQQQRQQANVPPQRREPQQAAPHAPVPPEQQAARPPQGRQPEARPQARPGEPPQHAALPPAHAPAMRPAAPPQARTAAVLRRGEPSRPATPPHPAPAAQPQRTAQAPAQRPHGAPPPPRPAPAKPQVAQHDERQDQHHD